MLEDKMLAKETDWGKQKMKETKAFVVREFKSLDLNLQYQLDQSLAVVLYMTIIRNTVLPQSSI